MKPRITVITIGVDDLESAVRFYRNGLGLKTEGIIGKEFEYGAVAFFDLQASLELAVWPRKSIAHDSGLPQTERSATEFTLGHNVASRAEVDAVMKQAQDAGAIVVKPAQDTFWEDMLVISKTLMDIYGKSYGIRNYCRKMRHNELKRTNLKH